MPGEDVKPISSYALDRKWDNYMFCPEHGQRHPKGDVWLPNQGRIGMFLNSGAEEHHQPILLSDINGQVMLLKAQTQYADFVTALKVDFGLEPIWEVGIVAYA